MVFWRFVDKQTLSDLQERSGINFTFEVIDAAKSKTTELSSLNSYIIGSHRDKNSYINNFIPFESGIGGVKVKYQAPTRQFNINWFNSTTLISILLYTLMLLSISLLVHYLIIRPIFMKRNPIEPATPSCQNIPTKLKLDGALNLAKGIFHY